MRADLAEKRVRLQDALRELGRVAVALSGGVDSSLLAKVAFDTLGDDALAVTVRLRSTPGRDAEAARDLCRSAGIEQVEVDFDELAVEGFAENPSDRCYLCKRAMLAAMREAAETRGFSTLAEGSNVDDEGDWRPGMRAVAEAGVASPLRTAGLTKADVRDMARELGLVCWDRPSAACLSSRVAYGDRITAAKLERIAGAEAWLRGYLGSQGLAGAQVRVRVHGREGEVARIEVEPQAQALLAQGDARGEVVAALTDLGFVYVALDLAGFRSGSANIVLGRQHAL